VLDTTACTKEAKFENCIGGRKHEPQKGLPRENLGVAAEYHAPLQVVSTSQKLTRTGTKSIANGICFVVKRALQPKVDLRDAACAEVCDDTWDHKRSNGKSNCHYRTRSCWSWPGKRFDALIAQMPLVEQEAIKLLEISKELKLCQTPDRVNIAATGEEIVPSKVQAKQKQILPKLGVVRRPVSFRACCLSIDCFTTTFAP
jgi:hypothetical protein